MAERILPRSVSRRAKYRALSVCVVASLLWTGTVAHAADDKKNDREARRAQMLQQRLEQEEGAWQTEKTDLQKKITDAESASAALKVQSDKVTSDLDKTNADRTSLQKKVTDLTKQLADAKDASAKAVLANKSELDHLMQAREMERVTLNKRYDSQTALLATCTDKNQRLLDVAHGLLVRYRDKGVIDALRQDDPVLGFKDVDMFNQVQAYQDAIDAQRFKSEDPVKP